MTQPQSESRTLKAGSKSQQKSAPTGASNKDESPSIPPEAGGGVAGAPSQRAQTLRPMSPRAGLCNLCGWEKILSSSLWDFSNITDNLHEEPLAVLSVQVSPTPLGPLLMAPTQTFCHFCEAPTPSSSKLSSPAAHICEMSSKAFRERQASPPHPRTGG